MNSQVIGFSKEEYINDDISIHVFDIKEINEELKNIIDNHIIRVCDGPEEYETTINYVKEKIKRFIDNKKPEDSSDKEKDTFIGAISEFFIHVFLNHLGFQQECLFFNLEERSIKKGFDGYYTFQEDSWIMESKSGHSTTQSISHSSKVNLSYSQLKKKITTCNEQDNDPWDNAFNHAKRVNSSEDVLKELKKYSQNFIKGSINNNINDFNIIPCSSIFYYEDWEENKIEIIETIKSKISTFEYAKIKVICINKRLINLFLNYLEISEDG